MIRVVDFKKEHGVYLLKANAKSWFAPYMTVERFQTLETEGKTLSAIDENDKVIACAGIVDYWPGRGEAWAMFDSNCKQHFLSVHRAVLRFLDLCPIRRIEASVDCEFAEGHRWMKLLGFELESERMKHYRPDSGDCSLYVRFSKERVI